jgi:hypothetical protein
MVYQKQSGSLMISEVFHKSRRLRVTSPDELRTALATALDGRIRVPIAHVPAARSGRRELVHGAARACRVDRARALSARCPERVFSADLRKLRLRD